MKLLADENLEDELIGKLRLEGYEVLSIKEINPGMSDDDVLRLAENNNAILLTNDKDFGELIFRLRLVSKGVVLLRLSESSLSEKVETATDAIRKYSAKLANAFTVISESSVRIRKSF